MGIKVMLCLDQSDGSRAAIPACRELAALAGAEVTVVQVIRPPEVDTGEAWSGSNERGRELSERRVLLELPTVERALEEVAETIGGDSRVVVIEAEDVVEALVGFAAQERIDVIALSTHRPPKADREAEPGDTVMGLFQSQVAPLLLVNPGPPPPPADEIPAGVFVFTRDGQELGEIEEVGPERFRLRNTADGSSIWLSIRDARPITAARMVVEFEAADIGKHAELA